jgi:hypothetical protein
MSLVRLLIIGCGLVANATPLAAQTGTWAASDTVVIRRLSGPITFDGLSDESAWADAFSMDFTVFRPVWGEAPSEHTEMLVGYDDEYLYVAGRCYTRDSSTLVVRNLVRDGWRGDDWMTLHVDNNFDRQNALVFSIYPLGSRYDAAISNDGVNLGRSTFNQDFDMFWDARSVVHAGGWFFEMRIPLYNLRLRRTTSGEVMVGISGARILQHHQEMHLFPAIPQYVVDAMSRPSYKQPARLEDVEPRRLFLVTPYLLASRGRQHRLDPDVNAYRAVREQVLRPGLDVKIGINSYLTLDLSANPDFAQVEADDQLLNLTRFSLFFPEKRLFFQEAAGLFEFNLGRSTQLFYSRQIGINDGQLTDVYGGARLTGKLDAKTDIGVLHMHTAPVYEPGGNRIAGAENFSALRLRRSVLNRRSFAGFMATNRWGALANNTALGMDAVLNTFGDHYIQAAVSTTLDDWRTPTAASSRVNLVWELMKSDGFFGQIGYAFSGVDFNPMSGFLDRTDFHQLNGQFNYGKFASSKSAIFQYLRWQMLYGEAFRSSTRGHWESTEVGSRLSATAFNGNFWQLSVSHMYEFLIAPLRFSPTVSLDPGHYRFVQAGFEFAQPRNTAFRNAFSLSEGGFFNGRRFSANYNPILSLGPHWEIHGTYSINYLRFADEALREAIHIARLRVLYALNLHLSINYVLQYNSLARQVFNNFRLRYNFRDGHDLYVVWNENFFTERMRYADLMRPLSDNQQFILKYNVTFDRLLRK